MALAAPALAAPDNVNLLSWEPALRWGAPSNKGLICFQNGEVRIGFCNFVCVCGIVNTKCRSKEESSLLHLQIL